MGIRWPYSLESRGTLKQRRIALRMILGVGLLCLVLFSPSIQGLENSTVDPSFFDWSNNKDENGTITVYYTFAPGSVSKVEEKAVRKVFTWIENRLYSTAARRCGDSRHCGRVHFDYMQSPPSGLTRLVIKVDYLCESDQYLYWNEWNGIERSLKPTKEGLTHYASNITKTSELGSTISPIDVEFKAFPEFRMQPQMQISMSRPPCSEEVQGRLLNIPNSWYRVFAHYVGFHIFGLEDDPSKPLVDENWVALNKKLCPHQQDCDDKSV